MVKYAKIALIDRKRLVYAYEKGEDYIHLADQLSINKKTARNIITVYQNETRV